VSYYFAYGSNLDQAQMRRRCPSAHEVGTGDIKGWALRFTGWSRVWAGAVADIEQLPGAVTHGAVYELPYSELVGRMDAFEGCPAVYRRIRVNVALRGGGGLRCWTYAKVRRSQLGVPSAAYFASIWYGCESRCIETQPLIDALCGEARAVIRNPSRAL
jgi:cation transport regulator ChaC